MPDISHLGIQLLNPLVTDADTTVPDWWDPNGVGLSVVAAYRAIATVDSPYTNDPPANYAASLVNNANPGVNDLVEGNGAVPWAAATGWGFVTAQQKYFDTGLVPANDQSWSVFAQYANGGVTTQYLLGAYNGIATGFFAIANSTSANNAIYGNGGITQFPPRLSVGNLAAVGSQGYRDGVAEGVALAAWGGASVLSVYIGVRHDGGVPFGYTTANLSAVAFYNAGPAAVQAQVPAIAQAMALL